MEQFKKLANKLGKNGLYSSIDLSFQLLLGEGSLFHSGQSVFQFQPTYCEASLYNLILQRISEGIILYETALLMDNIELPKTTRADWAKYFARVGKVFFNTNDILNLLICTLRSDFEGGRKVVLRA